MKEKSLEKIMTTTIYTMSILLFLNSTSMLMIWLSMELNMIMFIMWMKSMLKSKKNFFSSNMLFYFMIQTMGSILFLMGASMSPNLNELTSKITILMSIMLKSGLYPLEKWMFMFSKELEENTFLVLITLQKIPLLYMMTQILETWMIAILIVNMIAGSILIWKSMEVKMTLVASSIYSNLWMVAMLIMSTMNFLALYIKYTISMWMLTSSNKKKETTESKIKMIMGTMFLLGLPPMDMFFIKMFSLSLLTKNLENMTMMIIWVTTFLATGGYFKMLYHQFTKKMEIQKNYKEMKNMKLISMSVASSILMFM